MKTFFLLAFCVSLTFAQQDTLSEALKYYPLQNGDYWEYMDYYLSYNPYEEDSSFYSLEVAGDTLMSNGKSYKVLLRKSIPFDGYIGKLFERVDTSTACVYIYITEPVFPENEFLSDSLLSDSGDIFAGSLSGHSFGGGNYFQTICTDVYQDTIWNLATDFKNFQDESDIPAVTYTLGKGLGLIGTWAWELAYFSKTLRYARIDSIEYGTQITAISDDDFIPPDNFTLFQNYPNPFNPETYIAYKISHPVLVSIKVYDVLGNEIETLVNEEKTAGRYNIKFDGGNLASGIYFYVLGAGEFVQSKKMLLIK